MFLALLASTLTGCLPAGTPLGDGLHERVETSNGPVHLWCPASGRPELLVVYVHGYFDSVDDAFRNHGLVEQFQRSGAPAVFVMIEAPKGPKEAVRWTSFEALRSAVATRLEGAVPERSMVLGHSGGNRTLREWARAGEVDDVVLLDAFYGDPAPWSEFLRAVPHSRLQLVGALTFAKAETWRQTLSASEAHRVEQLAAKTSHMGVVTDGRWIPQLVRARLDRGS